MAFLKLLREIDPCSEANDGPAVKHVTTRNKLAQDVKDAEAARIAVEMAIERQQRRARVPSVAEWNAMSDAEKRERYGDQADGTPLRDAYLFELQRAITALHEASRLNPNVEHALMTIAVEIKNIASGLDCACDAFADDSLDFSESLEAGMPEH